MGLTLNFKYWKVVCSVHVKNDFEKASLDDVPPHRYPVDRRCGSQFIAQSLVWWAPQFLLSSWLYNPQIQASKDSFYWFIQDLSRKLKRRWTVIFSRRQKIIVDLFLTSWLSWQTSLHRTNKGFKFLQLTFLAVMLSIIEVHQFWTSPNFKLFHKLLVALYWSIFYLSQAQKPSSETVQAGMTANLNWFKIYSVISGQMTQQPTFSPTASQGWLAITSRGYFDNKVYKVSAYATNLCHPDQMTWWQPKIPDTSKMYKCNDTGIITSWQSKRNIFWLQINSGRADQLFWQRLYFWRVNNSHNTCWISLFISSIIRRRLGISTATKWTLGPKSIRKHECDLLIWCYFAHSQACEFCKPPVSFFSFLTSV